MVSLISALTRNNRGRSVQDKAPVPLSDKYVRGSSFYMGSDKRSQMSLYEQNTTVHGIVSRLALDTSQSDWHLFRKKVDQRRNYGPASDDRVEILPTAHQAAKVWNKPNSFYTQQEFVESFMQHLELTGVTYWVVQYDEMFHIPAHLWVVTPERMCPVPDPEEYLKGWIYTSADGEKVPLDRDQVIQIRVPNPLNQYDGSTPVSPSAADIVASRNASLANNMFYTNGAVPGGVIEVPESLGDEDFDRLKIQWREMHQGVDNAYRVAILEQGATFKSISPTSKDQQYVEQRQFTSEAVRESWTFPRFMLGMPEGTNRATAEAAEYVYAKWHIFTRLKRIKQALNNDFLPLFGATSETVEFDFDNPIPEDLDREASERTSKAQAFQTYIDAGVDPEEAANICGLPPMKMRVKEVPSGNASVPEPAA